MKRNELKASLEAHIIDINTKVEELAGLLKSTQGTMYSKEIGIMARKMELATNWAEHIIDNIDRQEAEEEQARKEEEAAKKRKAEEKAKKIKEAKEAKE